MTSLHNAILYTCMVLWYQLMVWEELTFCWLTFQLSVLPSSPGEKWSKCEETLLYIAGPKMKFPIGPVDMKSDHAFSTNPVEDRAKCRMCMTFGSILCRIGGEQSMKCQISRSRDRWEISFLALCYSHALLKIPLQEVKRWWGLLHTDTSALLQSWSTGICKVIKSLGVSCGV